MTHDEMLAREAQVMSRDVELLHVSTQDVTDESGRQHRVTLLSYRLAPFKLPEAIGGETIHESRFVVYVDDEMRTGGTL